MRPTTNGGRPSAAFANALAEVREYVRLPDSLGRELADMASQVRASNDARQAGIDAMHADWKAAAGRGDLKAVLQYRRVVKAADDAAARERALIRRLDAESRAAFRAAANDGGAAL